MRWGFQHEAVWRPPTDVYETDESAVVIVEIAGLREGDYDISLLGRTLVISGDRRDPAEKLTYQQMEIRYGKFRTQVYLPWPIDSSAIDVQYESGLLKVKLRKAQVRRIPVQVVENGEKDNNNA
jgi:HSP20 family molecular chaperone IbpA